MKKVNKKLELHKEVIANLTPKDQSKIIGGAGETIGTVCIQKTAQAACITKTVDIHTAGHDDGSNCLSKTDWGWCWCKGV